MELTARYGLEFNPFLKNSREILYKEQGIQRSKDPSGLPSPKRKASGLLTDSPEGARLLVIRNWSSALSPSLYKVVYTCLSTLTVNDFIGTGLPFSVQNPHTGKQKTSGLIQDEINRLALDKHKTPVIIIDEANYISNTVRNDLKILFNLKDSRDRAVILLVGLPQLNNTLKLSIHEPLRQGSS